MIGATASETGTPRKRLAVIVTICVGVFMVSLDMFIVNLAFPNIEHSFRGSGLTTLSWILNAYAICFGALLVPAGHWADRVGRKRAFLTGLAIFTVMSAVCAAAPSVAVLVVARALQAVGAALLYPATLGLLLPQWPASRSTIAVAVWAAVGGVAAAAGPPLGGLLVQIGWRWVFLVNVPIGIVALAVGIRVLAEHRAAGTANESDWVAAILFTTGIAAVILAIVQGQTWGWGSVSVISVFVAAIAMIAIVAFRCTRHPAPLIEPAIIRTRVIVLADLSALFFYMGFAALVLGMVLFQTEVWHDSDLRTGLQFAPGPLTSAFIALPAARIARRVGPRVVGGAGAVLFAGSIVYFRSHMTLQPHYVLALLPTVLIGGTGIGLVLPTLSGAATATLPAPRLATGAALLGMARQVGSALGVAVVVVLLTGATPTNAVHHFSDVWIFLIACVLVAGAIFSASGPTRAVGERRPAEPTRATALAGGRKRGPATAREVSDR